MKNNLRIKCNFCREIFYSVADFENHIDIECSKSTLMYRDTIESIGTQILYPDGKSRYKELIRRKVTPFKSDGEVTEPFLDKLKNVAER